MTYDNYGHLFEQARRDTANKMDAALTLPTGREGTSSRRMEGETAEQTVVKTVVNHENDLIN
jgi:hypothetical protein